MCCTDVPLNVGCTLPYTGITFAADDLPRNHSNVMDKRELRLGDEVLWNGQVAVVDTLTQTCVALVCVDNNDYVIVSYADIQRKN